MKFFNGTRDNIKQRGLTILLTLACAVSLAACGGDTAPPTQVAQPTSVTSDPVNPSADTPVNPIKDKASNSMNVELSEWAILPANVGLPVGPTRMTVINKGEFDHNLVIKNGDTEIARTPNFTKAESPKELVADLQPGNYIWLCDIPGHAEKGMTGTLNVTK